MTLLPDCMMPDGGDCCIGHQELHAENERLRTALDKICGIVLGRKDGLSAAKIHKITLEALNPAPGRKTG